VREVLGRAHPARATKNSPHFDTLVHTTSRDVAQLACPAISADVPFLRDAPTTSVVCYPLSASTSIPSQLHRARRFVQGDQFGLLLSAANTHGGCRNSVALPTQPWTPN
jgi:hypothetical protein